MGGANSSCKACTVEGAEVATSRHGSMVVPGSGDPQAPSGADLAAKLAQLEAAKPSKEPAAPSEGDEEEKAPEPTAKPAEAEEKSQRPAAPATTAERKASAEVASKGSSSKPTAAVPAPRSTTPQTASPAPPAKGGMRERFNKRLPGLAVNTNKDGGGGIPGRKVKTIKAMTEAEFSKKYKLKDNVMESCHPGMSVLFATRLSDKKDIVIKVRVKAQSFKKNSNEELEWRGTMEMQLNMPKSDVICELMEVIETDKTYYVVMEKVEGADLFETMSQESINHVDAREIVRQVLLGLKSMHDAGRIHKDLKLENVMVDMESPTIKVNAGRAMSPRAGISPLDGEIGSPLSAKLIDFDTVENWEPNSPKAKDVLGTDGYIAPEAYLGTYSPASDIYCVGVIMYKLLTNRFPSRKELFDDRPGENYVGSPAMRRIYNRLKNTEIDFTRSPFDECPAAESLCESLLAFEAEKRPSADDALAHEWFSLPGGSLPARVRGRR